MFLVLPSAVCSSHSIAFPCGRSVGNRKSSANNRNSGNILTSCFIGLRFRLTGPTAHFGLIKIIGASPYFPQLTVVHISLAWFSLYSGLQEYRRPCSQEHMSNCTKCHLVKCSYVYRATLQICRLNFYFLIYSYSSGVLHLTHLFHKLKISNSLV